MAPADDSERARPDCDGETPGGDGHSPLDRLAGEKSTRMLGAGLTMAAAVGLFAWGGLWLDGVCGTSPWLLVAGVLLGTAGGFIHVVSVMAPELLPWGRGAAAARRGPSPDSDRSSRGGA